MNFSGQEQYVTHANCSAYGAGTKLPWPKGPDTLAQAAKMHVAVRVQ